jgi:putative membrane protein
MLGGLLMGLANLVPGISGGTMLLAAGVYPDFIQGIADVTALRWRPRGLAVLASIGGVAALAIVTLAGPMKALVVGHRWAMFSLFIGLTLGGIPVVWRLLRPLSAAAVAGGVVGVLAMVAMALVQPGAGTAAGAAGPDLLLLFVAGVAGASAMILPGVSGGYLLLILGQYLTILGAVDAMKNALLRGGAGASLWAALEGPLHVFLPVGIGVCVGIAGISNLIRYLLVRHEKPTLGFLLGLLLGAVLGLWPFQQGVPPEPGDVVRGSVMTPERIAALEPEAYPLAPFTPSALQVAGSLGLVLLGFGVTQAVARVGAGGERTGAPREAGAGARG